MSEKTKDEKIENGERIVLNSMYGRRTVEAIRSNVGLYSLYESLQDLFLMVDEVVTIGEEKVTESPEKYDLIRPETAGEYIIEHMIRN